MATLSPCSTPPPTSAAPRTTDSSSFDLRPFRVSTNTTTTSRTDREPSTEDDSGAARSGRRDSSVGLRLGTVTESGVDYKRESHTSTFGGGTRAGGVSSPELEPSPAHSAAPSPTPMAVGGEESARPSLSPSDALRRQSILANVDPLRNPHPRPSIEKPEELIRDSYEDPDGLAGDGETRPVSGSYRLTLKTTNDSTGAGAVNGAANGMPGAEYGGGESSNGHGDYKKVNHPHIPRSSYYVGPPPLGSAFGTDPIGEIGVHFPREVVRVERDYSGGELVQFYPTYPLEFEGRVTPTKFQASINEINEVLISAYSLRHSAFENMLGVATLYLSTLILETHYDKEMKRLAALFDRLNRELYNPAGLNLLWPRKVGFLFLEIEYY